MVLQKDPLSRNAACAIKMFQMSINLRLDVIFHFAQCYQLNCSLGFPYCRRAEEFRISVLKTCRTSPIKQKVFVLVCVFLMYLVEHVIIHPVHKKRVPSTRSYCLVRRANPTALALFCTATCGHTREHPCLCSVSDLSD